MKQCPLLNNVCIETNCAFFDVNSGMCAIASLPGWIEALSRVKQ